MKYTSQYFAQSETGEKFFVGDEVRVHWSTGGGGVWGGTLTHITSKGVYIDVGNKRDKYVSFIDIEEISKQ